MAAPPIATSQPYNLSGLSAEALARALWSADVPEEFIKTVPAQSLYLAIKSRGISCCADVISIATIEQCRAMLDFDCWEADRFSEERLLEWLALGDFSEQGSDDGLQIIQKLLKSIDLRLIGVLVSRHIQVATFDEPTEEPPSPGFYTPDQGHTWILIQTENADQHFHLGRLLALLFETSPEIFYQILASPQVATETMLEEEAFVDRQKRMASLGIPEADVVAETHCPVSLPSILRELEGKARSIATYDVESISPLIYDSEIPTPLSSLIPQVSDRESLERELTFLLNGAMVRWSVTLHDVKAVAHMTRKVRGAMNIGLEAISLSGHPDILEVYDTIGLTRLYQLGLHHLFTLRSLSLKISSKHMEKLAHEDPARHVIVAGCQAPFPEAPMQLLLLDRPINASVSTGEHSIDASASTRMEAISKIAHIRALQEILKSELPNTAF